MSAAPDPIDLAFGARVRFLRTDRRLSLEELGRRVGVTYQQIQKYETGANRVAISTGVRLAQALGVSLATLARGDDETAPTIGAAALAHRIEALAPHQREAVFGIVDVLERHAPAPHAEGQAT